MPLRSRALTRRPFAAMGALLAAAFLLLLPAPAFAWSAYAHGIVARIALAEVRPSTRAEMLRLLARHDLLETPQCRSGTIEDLASWADCATRVRDRYGHTGRWHYQNIHICRPFDAGANCADGNCVTAQVERFAERLSDRRLPMRDRVEALAFLIHFVGDMHNPPHIADRADRGGNDTRTSYGVLPTNLHWMWDSALAERAITTPLAGAGGLRREVSRAERRLMAAGTVTDWSREVWDVGRGEAYPALFADPCDAEAEPGPVTQERIAALIPVARRQVLRAGLRLARLLDEALS